MQQLQLPINILYNQHIIYTFINQLFFKVREIIHGSMMEKSGAEARDQQR